MSFSKPPKKMIFLLAGFLFLQPFYGLESISAQPNTATKPPAVAPSDFLNAARKTKNLALIAKAYFQLGGAYQKHGKLTEARAIYTEGLTYARKSLPANHPMPGLLLCQISTTYMHTQDFDQALPYLNDGLTILKRNPQMGQVALKLETLRDMLTHFNGGLKALKRYKYPQSETSFRAALAISSQAQEASLISIAQSSLGLSQLMQDKFGEAEISLAQALQYSKKTNMQEARLMALIAYATLYARQGQVETAHMYYEEALSQHDEVFRRIQIPKALFEQEMERLEHVRAELAQSKAAIDASDYYEDVLWKQKIFHWNTRNGAIKVYIAPATGIANWTPDYAERFKAACKQWQLALGDRVRFSFTENPTDKADVTVHWNGGYDKLAGLTRCQHYAGRLAKADITLNLKNYDNQLHSPETVYRLSLHEVGHLLGLMGHSRSPKDIMFPSLAMASGLSSRDTATLRKLYAQKAQISNPAKITLTEYRQTPEYLSIQSAIEALHSH